MSLIVDDQPSFVCPHVTPSSDYHVWFTGKSGERFWVCEECAKAHPRIPEGLIEFDRGSNLAAEYDGSCLGICGKPEISFRETSLRFEHREYSLPIRNSDRLVDIQPYQGIEGSWLVLMASGKLCQVNFERSEFLVLYHSFDLGFEIDDETAFCMSAEGGFAAIYQVSGSNACVFDLRTGRKTARIHRGNYRPENSSFPIAFFGQQGYPLLVAATDWNRLDVIEPNSGAILTQRGPTSCESGKKPPEHYLDYFHAQLLISPDSSWIADNGWVWSPWGVVRSWNLSKWLKQNPWESEDGETCRSVVSRAYYWDGPLCWINATTLAVWGWGDDDEWLIPAIRLFDVQQGRELGWFPGPEVRPRRAWPPKKVPASLFFDQYLLAARDEIGSTVWDIETGDRLLADPGFAPVAYHRKSKEFLSHTPTGIRLSRLIADA